MPNTVNVYLVWYGSWTGDTATTILPSFIASLGSSPYFATNATYGDSAGRTVSGNLSLAGQTTDSYSQGSSLSDAQVQAIVTSAISGGRLPQDANGVYMVLTSADVTSSADGGFCVGMCGYHAHNNILGVDTKYAFIGNSARCPSACAAGNPGNSPNGNVGADGMASIIAHELDEAVTDPDLNAWYLGNVNHENGDLCAWTFGSEYTVANGSSANMVLGGRNYLVQQDWAYAAGGACTLIAPPVVSESIAGCNGSWTLDWAAIPGATSYAVWRQTSGGPFTMTKTITSTTLDVLAGQSGNPTKSYEIQACVGTACGALSEAVTPTPYSGCP
jgi:hypothetical protein